MATGDLPIQQLWFSIAGRSICALRGRQIHLFMWPPNQKDLVNLRQWIGTLVSSFNVYNIYNIVHIYIYIYI